MYITALAVTFGILGLNAYLHSGLAMGGNPFKLEIQLNKMDHKHISLY